MTFTILTCIEGLVRAAFSTNAWILTHGLNFGVVNVVSDAISRAESYYLRNEKKSGKIHCIGVAPWGFVKNHEKLIGLSVRQFYFMPINVLYSTQGHAA